MDYTSHEVETALKQNNQDPRLRIRFESVAVQRDPTIEEIERDGDRPQFDDIIYLEKSVPGDTQNIIRRPASDKDKRKFARAWQAFVAKDSGAGRGHPLSAWTPCSAGQAKTLEVRNVYTVEELAALSETSARNVGPGYLDLSKRAQVWLASAKDAANSAKLQRERDEARNEIEVLKDQVAKLIEASNAKKTKKGD